MSFHRVDLAKVREAVEALCVTLDHIAHCGPESDDGKRCQREVPLLWQCAVDLLGDPLQEIVSVPANYAASKYLDELRFALRFEPAGDFAAYTRKLRRWAELIDGAATIAPPVPAVATGKAAGADNSADKSKKKRNTRKAVPDDPVFKELVNRLLKELPESGKSENQIAIEVAKGDKKTAASLLRKLRRYEGPRRLADSARPKKAR